MEDLFKDLHIVLNKDQSGTTLIDTEAINTKEESEDSKEKIENTDNLIEIKDQEEEKEEEGIEVTSEAFKPLAQFLKDEEVLSSLDIEKFDGTIEGLKDAFKTELEEWKEGYKQSLHPAIKELQDRFEDGVPFDELLGIKSEQIRFDNIDDESIAEDEDLQKNILFYHLKETTNWSDTKIEKEVKRLSDVGEAPEEAKEALKELKVISKKAEEKLIADSKEQAKRDKDKADENIRNINDFVTKTTEIIPGIKLSDKEKQTLITSVTKPVEIKDNKYISKVMKVREKDPIGFEIKLNYFIEKGFFDGKFDTILNTAKTKAVQDLEKQTLSKITKTGNNGIKTESTGSDILTAFNKKIKK